MLIHLYSTQIFTEIVKFLLSLSTHIPNLLYKFSQQYVYELNLSHEILNLAKNLNIKSRQCTDVKTLLLRLYLDQMLKPQLSKSKSCSVLRWHYLIHLSGNNCLNMMDTLTKRISNWGLSLREVLKALPRQSRAFVRNLCSYHRFWIKLWLTYPLPFVFSKKFVLRIIKLASLIHSPFSILFRVLFQYLQLKEE